MPSDDLILDVRQIEGYPPAVTSMPSDAILIQRGGLGGPYMSIDPVTLVGTALAQGGEMSISGPLLAASIQTGSLQASNGAFGLLTAQQASIDNLTATWGSFGTVSADIANFVQAQIAGLSVAGDMQVGGTANLANAVVQANLTASYANVLQSLDARDLNVSNLATICNLIVNGNIAVPNGAITMGGYAVLTTGNAADWGFAPLASPAFTGNPTAPTPAIGPTPPTDNSTSIATTAFVVGVVNQLAGQVSAQFAPINAPVFTGVPTAPTAQPGNSTGQLATTAFVMNAVTESTTGVASFNARTGAVTLETTDVIDAGGAPITSPAFLGSDRRAGDRHHPIGDHPVRHEHRRGPLRLRADQQPRLHRDANRADAAHRQRQQPPCHHPIRAGHVDGD
jgi:hypothetical protein